MLIKLRIKFYQVQCDAFAELATELLDIPAIFRRAVSNFARKACFFRTLSLFFAKTQTPTKQG